MSITTSILLAGNGGDGVTITPNATSLPGAASLEGMVGTLVIYAVIAAVAGLLIAAIVWAVGNHSSNPQLASRGKTGVLVSFVAAILAGGATLLISFFYNIGSAL